jgi:hypothetical protein
MRAKRLILKEAGMASSQLVGVVVNIAIYVALIGFILFRQMSRASLNPRRLILLPGLMALFAIQQLSRQTLTLDLGTVAFLVASLAVSILAGIWRGTTFRIWNEAGVVMTKGTVVTLIAWGALIVSRIPFAVASHGANFAQGLVIGELLLALAVTFAAQNAVIWLRATRVMAINVDAG